MSEEWKIGERDSDSKRIAIGGYDIEFDDSEEEKKVIPRGQISKKNTDKIKDSIKNQAQREYYAKDFRGSISIAKGLENKRDVGFTADSMLSLYNIIPDGRNVVI